MQTIGLIVNGDKPTAAQAARRVAEHARELGLRLLAEPETVALAGGGEPWLPSAVADFGGRAEAVVALGGDGTLLQAAHAIQGSELPLMGLNIGSLGYLTSVEEAQFGEAMRTLRDENFVLSVRATLASSIVRATGDVETLAMHALNDVVVGRGASMRLAHIALALDGVPVTTYACDGIIVATATGSTAYSLSTGGPIVMPSTEALVIALICPHSLGARPLIVPEHSRISIGIVAAAAPLLLAIDGVDVTQMEIGDRLEIVESGMPVRLAFQPDHNPYRVMSRKLGWGGREVK